jgi:F-type H+-transporting ATPase subunit epsilon
MANHLDTVNEQKTRTRKPKNSELDVLIYAPFRTYFDGLAKSVSAKNGKGPFDVLPMHHSFITLLDPGEIVVETEQGEQRFKIEKGLMHVSNNLVTIYLDV